MTVNATSESRSFGIPTTYHGTRFRSRLEARWAAFFDLVDWSWVYEPFDTGHWIPDFAITGANGVNGSAPFLVEVGPCVSQSEYVDKATKPLDAFPIGGLDGGFHSERITLILGIAPHALDDERAGYMTNSNWGEGPGWVHWARCQVCGEMAVARTGGFESFQHMPCGHHDDPKTADIRRLADRWSEAGNKVQWRAR